MLNDAMKKLMKDKKGEGSKKMSDTERSAKTSVLEHMRDMAQDMMGDKLGGLKKVTVASPDPEGLSKGLEAAREMVSAHKTEHPDEDAEAAEGREEANEAQSSELDKTEHESAEEASPEEGNPAEEAAESPEKDAHEDVTGSSEDAYGPMTAQEIDHKIKKLQDHKMKLHGMR